MICTAAESNAGVCSPPGHNYTFKTCECNTRIRCNWWVCISLEKSNYVDEDGCREDSESFLSNFLKIDCRSEMELECWASVETDGGLVDSSVEV